VSGKQRQIAGLVLVASWRSSQVIDEGDNVTTKYITCFIVIRTAIWV